VTVDVQRGGEGHWTFRLGPVEKAIVSAIGAAVVGVGWWLVSSMQTVMTQQAVTNQQLLAISAQLADVPALSRRMAEHQVRLDRLESDMKELRATRNLR